MTHTRRWIVLLVILLALGFVVSLPRPVHAQSGGTYVVQRGDTLFSISRRYGVSVHELAQANGLPWNSWIYIGQRLVIPGMNTSPAPATGTGGVYVVRAGDTLFSIARRHGTTVTALKSANGLYSNLIYVGQRLALPGRSSAPAATPAPRATAAPSSPPAGHGANGEKWIDIDLSAQRVTAYEGRTAVFSAIASTGTARTPTVVGTYHIYAKYPATRMSGPGYNYPNVPNVMFFYRGYSIHGTYWHNNFGTPMSHGCVNLTIPDAERFYNWAPLGTKVVTHH